MTTHPCSHLTREDEKASVMGFPIPKLNCRCRELRIPFRAVASWRSAVRVSCYDDALLNLLDSGECQLPAQFFFAVAKCSLARARASTNREVSHPSELLKHLHALHY
jgi:hypothetical protein